MFRQFKCKEDKHVILVGCVIAYRKDIYSING
jgi:hypothetical protein